MHNLAVLAEDGGKAYALGIGACDAVHLSGDETFGQSGSHQLHGFGVHLVTHLAGALDGLNFLGLLGAAQFHHRLDEWQ